MWLVKSVARNATGSRTGSGTSSTPRRSGPCAEHPCAPRPVVKAAGVWATAMGRSTPADVARWGVGAIGCAGIEIGGADAVAHPAGCRVPAVARDLWGLVHPVPVHALAVPAIRIVAADTRGLILCKPVRFLPVLRAVDDRGVEDVFVFFPRRRFISSPLSMAQPVLICSEHARLCAAQVSAQIAPAAPRQHWV